MSGDGQLTQKRNLVKGSHRECVESSFRFGERVKGKENMGGFLKLNNSP